ncbi:hypothetical protein CAC42_3664 [Sphaceloma murrayae]|uniref:Uncharacterized protein n=1 Tax=Sphaceloma murrayae TaxID=2082308 RepID=A0A2K1QPT0_9PEZI|nr:hypothetical protein CAC42_3664 [Sphaceloma murrayae]
MSQEPYTLNGMAGAVKAETGTPQRKRRYILVESSPSPFLAKTRKYPEDARNTVHAFKPAFDHVSVFVRFVREDPIDGSKLNIKLLTNILVGRLRQKTSTFNIGLLNRAARDKLDPRPGCSSLDRDMELIFAVFHILGRHEPIVCRKDHELESALHLVYHGALASNSYPALTVWVSESLATIEALPLAIRTPAKEFSNQMTIAKASNGDGSTDDTEQEENIVPTDARPDSAPRSEPIQNPMPETKDQSTPGAIKLVKLSDSDDP